MSTSLKVVSIAAVFCASFSRRAMVWRSRVIFTRSSRAASSAGEGARTCTAAAGCATGVGAAAARSIAAIMSPLVTRPSLPEPSTFAGSMPVSAAILRTEGASGASAAATFGGAARRGAASALALRPPVRRGFAAAGFAGAPAPSLIWPSSAPTATVSPSFAAISLERAGGGRRHLDRHLVGLELDQRLVDRDRIARLLEPFADGRLGDGFAERRDADFGHAIDVPSPAVRIARCV